MSNSNYQIYVLATNFAATDSADTIIAVDDLPYPLYAYSARSPHEMRSLVDRGQFLVDRADTNLTIFSVDGPATSALAGSSMTAASPLCANQSESSTTNDRIGTEHVQSGKIGMRFYYLCVIIAAREM